MIGPEVATWSRESNGRRSTPVKQRVPTIRACVCTFLWYHYCSKCRFSRVCHSRPQITPRPELRSLYATVSLRRPISRRHRDASSDSRVFLFDRPATELAVVLVYLSITRRARLETIMLDWRTSWVNLPSIDRAASKSSVTPVRCRSFQRFCKVRLHRFFFFFLGISHQSASN